VETTQKNLHCSSYLKAPRATLSISGEFNLNRDFFAFSTVWANTSPNSGKYVARTRTLPRAHTVVFSAEQWYNFSTGTCALETCRALHCIHIRAPVRVQSPKPTKTPEVKVD